MLGTIIGHVAAQRPVVLHDLRPVRDYVWVNDLASAVVRAGTVPLNEPWRAFHVASGVVYQCGGSRIAGGRRLRRCDVPVVENHAGARPTRVDPGIFIGDPTRAERELAFRVRVPLRQGIRILVEATRRPVNAPSSAITHP